MILYLALWTNFSPVYDALRGTEIESFEFLMLSLAIWGLSREKELGAGLYLALAIFTKYLPAIFVPFLIYKRRYRAVFSCALASLAIIVITQITLGWEWNYTWRLLGSSVYGTTACASQSFSSWVLRFFTDVDLATLSSQATCTPPLQNEAVASWVAVIVSFSVVLGVGALMMRDRTRRIHDLEIALVSFLMVTAVKWNHMYYLIFLLIGYSVLLRIMVESKGARFDGLGLGVSLGLVGYFLPASVYQAALHTWHPYDFWLTYSYFSIPVYGYVLLLVILSVKWLKGDSAVLSSGEDVSSVQSRGFQPQ